MAVRITDYTVASYEVPLSRPFATARSVTTKANNYVVMLEGLCDGAHIGAMGEAAPRSVSLTGDTRAKRWTLLQKARDFLLSDTIDTATRESALASVRRQMASMERLAAALAISSNYKKPFRGTLAGLELALLDLAARARGETIADLLGKKRDEICITAATISGGRKVDEMPRLLASVRKRFAAYRLKGDKDVEKNLQMLELAAQVDARHGETRAHWLDLNEALDPAEADGFLRKVVAQVEKRSAYSEIILEQPVGKKYIAELCELQKTANRILDPQRGRIVIIADECLWDLIDYMELERHGGCGAINIKVPKTGGLIPALDLAEYVHRRNPDVKLYIGGMIGTSDLMSWSLLNLAKCLPRLDYITTFPKTEDAAINFVSNPFVFKQKGTSQIADQIEPGVGAVINVDQWRPFVRSVFPEESALAVQIGFADAAPDAPAGQDRSGSVPEELVGEASVKRIHLLEHESNGSPKVLINIHIRAGSHAAFGAAEAALPTTAGDREKAWGILSSVAAAIRDRMFSLDPERAKAEAEAAVRNGFTSMSKRDWAEATALPLGLEIALLDAICKISKRSLTSLFKSDQRLAAAVAEQEDAGANGRLDYASLLPTASRNAWIPEEPFRPDERFGDVNDYDVSFYEHFSTPGLDSHFFEREALRRGLNTERLTTVLFTADDQNGGQTGFSWSTATQTSHVTGILTGNKQITRQLLQRAGVPAPEGRRFPPDAKEAAVAYAKRLGFPVVLKPLVGTGGVGVVAGIQSEEDLNWALDALSRSSHEGESFIVERHVDGRDYRIFATRERALSVTIREPACVIGNGVLSVAELILQKNEVRRGNPHLMDNLIKLNDVAQHLLQKQGLTYRSVPEPNRRVVLASAANLKQGGDNIDVLKETHPSVLEVAVSAVRAIPGLPHAGVDILLEDHRRPVSDQSCGICELNCSPSQAGATPMYGTPAAISEYVFEREALARNIRLRPPADRLNVHIATRGRVQKVGFRAWVAGAAEQLRLDGWTRNSGRDTVETVLRGPARDVSVLASAMISGPEKARPEIVRTTHLDKAAGKGFRVLN